MTCGFPRFSPNVDCCLEIYFLPFDRFSSQAGMISPSVSGQPKWLAAVSAEVGGQDPYGPALRPPVRICGGEPEAVPKGFGGDAEGDPPAGREFGFWEGGAQARTGKILQTCAGIVRILMWTKV